jgi:hypothetical protein
MRYTLANTFLALNAIAMLACTQEAGRTRAGLDSLEILAVAGGDTAYLMPGANRFIWSRSNGRRWFMDSLFDARPVANLQLVDQDSIPDLFITVTWEEITLGELWLGRVREELLAFESAEDACRVPELRDVNADGRLDVVDWRAGAVTSSECGEMIVEVCRAMYPIEWPDVWIQTSTGTFMRDSTAAKTFYAAMARDYTMAALELRQAISEGAQSELESSQCNDDMAEALDGMAKRALAIVDMR